MGKSRKIYDTAFKVNAVKLSYERNHIYLLTQKGWESHRHSSTDGEKSIRNMDLGYNMRVLLLKTPLMHTILDVT